MELANVQMDRLIHKANEYAMQGDFGTSLGFILQAYELYQEQLGPDSLETIACTGLAARTYAALGRKEEALKFFTKAYEGYESVCGDNSQKTTHALRELDEYRAHLAKISL